jgi:hypothetical protein
LRARERVCENGKNELLGKRAMDLGMEEGERMKALKVGMRR